MSGEKETSSATALVSIRSSTGHCCQARALIDQGSEISLITERLAQRLHLPRIRSNISLIGVGGKKCNTSRGIVHFQLKPHFESSFECTVPAHVLPRLTTSLPSASSKQESLLHFKDLMVADPEWFQSRQIDLLLGAEVYCQILQEGIIKGPIGSPMAQLTELGWIISGPTHPRVSTDTSSSFHISIDDNLYRLIHKFWEIDEVPSTNTILSADDQACEDHFVSTHSRHKDGRYVVRLPFKRSMTHLGNSRQRAAQIMLRLSRKLSVDSSYSKLYTEFLTEYEELNHMRLISPHLPEPQHVYYLPHHGVQREQSLTTKLRVVFNGSSPSSSGFSLNDLLHTGAKLQIDLFDVLLWFRKFRYVFSSDMEKMYRQIEVHPHDWDFQRILWCDQSLNLRAYQLTTVTYGLACAPFLALRTIQQLLLDEGSKYPLAASSLQKGRYVDDLFGGADSIEQAQEVVSQLAQLCMAGGFKLKKWSSNQAEILSSIPKEEQISCLTVGFDNEAIIQTLGLQWLPSSDLFQFTFNYDINFDVTKRKVLSAIAKLFDPLGFLSPIIVTAKIFIQELWSIKISWDDPLPSHLVDQWHKFLDALREIPTITIPRWIGISSQSVVEVHGFSDASQKAMAAVVYLRVIDSTGVTSVYFGASKTKVAPLKRMTIPKLELSGAVLLTKLVSHILSVIQLANVPVILWTDSAITHVWLNNHPSKWKEFVRNRVSFIQETLPQAEWKFVPGHHNPSDIATRGVTPSQLSNHTEWWHGPPWLSQDKSSWPQPVTPQCPADNFEEQPSIVHVVTANPKTEWSLISRYSSLNKLYRITALCQRAVSRFRRVPLTSLPTSLTTVELNKAKLFWVQVTQQLFFPEEINYLTKGLPISRSSPLIRLTPFLDASGLLRVGGRLQNSLLSEDEKHPLILPRKSTLTMLIIADVHQRALHGGTQVTLATIRTEYWIVVIVAPLSKEQIQNYNGFFRKLKKSSKLANLLANNGTQWHFNPPSAPHFGGKWEAGVKSMKHHLIRVVGTATFTYEEMSTLLAQIEAVMNSRPLCPLSEDPDDLSVLTPGHFLMGCAPLTVPEPSLELVKTSRLSRWQLIQKTFESFWTRWSQECLQRYYSCYKWNRVMPSLQVGTIVLVIDERYPPAKWPLGRILATHPGQDGHTRVVTVKTQTSVLKRPVVKLCPLPVMHDSPQIVH
ncbi:PREDICTED: uncharacterized protein LOC108774017 [Cyphomyrmex costatus]|uniref:uncharacterized protein LOC108774017 n=1 Tax=Cyphomyrmex costatus TaxID=456900 RepID=UPI0008523E04|nr:PREDICTED: uncharacterized protein LOC108774017 [Cyphomyrmex costatus]